MVPRASDSGTSFDQLGMIGVRSAPSLTVWVLQPPPLTTWLPTGNAGFLLWSTLQKKQQQHITGEEMWHPSITRHPPLTFLYWTLLWYPRQPHKVKSCGKWVLINDKVTSKRTFLCVCRGLFVFLTWPLEFRSSRRLLSFEPDWTAWRGKKKRHLNTHCIPNLVPKGLSQTHDPTHLMCGSTLRNTASKSTSETKTEPYNTFQTDVFLFYMRPM